MRLFLSAAIAPALMLSACGGGEEAGNNSSDEASTTVEPVPGNAMVDPQNTVVPLTPAASPTPVATTTFPATFQGRWGLVAKDCDPAAADYAKGLMAIGPDRVTHYESRGQASRIETTSPTKLTAELAFTGEGQEWTRRTSMTLLDDGKTLATETPDDPEPPMRSLRYTRCPA